MTEVAVSWGEGTSEMMRTRPWLMIWMALMAALVPPMPARPTMRRRPPEWFLKMATLPAAPFDWTAMKLPDSLATSQLVTSRRPVSDSDLVREVTVKSQRLSGAGPSK